MTAVSPPPAQAPGSAPPPAKPPYAAHAAAADGFAFAGVLEGLSSSQAKGEQTFSSERTTEEDRRQTAPTPRSELVTASMDAALSSLFAAPLNAHEKGSEPAPNAGQRARGAANPTAAEATGSSGAPVGQVVPPRLVGMRSFVLPATASLTVAGSGPAPLEDGSRTEAGPVDSPAVADPPDVFPSTAVATARALLAGSARQAASPPAARDQNGLISLAFPEGSAATPQVEANISAGAAGARSSRAGVLTAPASKASIASETEPSNDAERVRPATAAPPSTKAPAPAVASGPRPAQRAGEESAGPGASPLTSAEAGRRDDDSAGSTSGDDQPNAWQSALPFGPAGAVAGAQTARGTQATFAGETLSPRSGTLAAEPEAKPLVREIDLDLSPSGLEDVTMTMRLSGDRLSVAIRAASSQTAGAIEGARDAIAERLAAIGQPLDSLVIQRTGGSDGAGNTDAHGDDAGRQAQGQASSDGRGRARRGHSGF
jgi:Flagellar hook-length control protein FliK